LGTYSGPKWASSMNISTILLSIYSLMTNNPLTHEPAYENTSLTHPKNQQYADNVEYRMIKLFLEMYTNNYYKKYMELDDDFKNTILKSYELIKEKVRNKSKNSEQQFTVLPYAMNGCTAYKKIAEQYC
jgi:hypothetical protein